MIARFVYAIGRLPLISTVLRKLANSYEEGSVTEIRSGHGKGLKWKRYHRFVNGYWLGIYEPELQELIVGELGEGKVFYDIGANAAFFSLIAARVVGPGGMVYAFEPLPENVGVVVDHIEINQLKNLELEQMAVGASVGEATFLRTGITSSHLGGGDENGGQTLKVRLTTLDEFVKDHRPPDFAKVDVEGAEAQVLEGASEVLRKHRPRLLIEMHTSEAYRRCEQILRENGYTITPFGGELRDTEAFPHFVLAYPGAGRSRIESSIRDGGLSDPPTLCV